VDSNTESEVGDKPGPYTVWRKGISTGGGWGGGTKRERQEKRKYAK